MADTVRTVIQLLINRGDVEVDEIEHLDPPCNPMEANALIPAWTNSSLARVLDRTLSNLHFIDPPPSPWWTLFFVLQTVEKSINRPIGQAFAETLGAQLEAALTGVRNVSVPVSHPSGYLLTAFDIATEAEQRLRNWPA